MEGGTTFRFVTDGIHSVLERARKAAGGSDVRIGGGIGVIRQFLRTRLIDDIHFAVDPVIVGRASPCWRASICRRSAMRSRPSHPPEALHVMLEKR